jgi:hypothetical protein
LLSGSGVKPRRLGEAALFAIALLASACGSGSDGVDNSEGGDAADGSTAPAEAQSVAGAAAPANAPAMANAPEMASAPEMTSVPDSGMLPPYPSGADQTAPFEVGAHVWFDSSVSIRVEAKMGFYAWGGSQASGSSKCRLLDRSAMRSYQLAMLAGVTLVAADGACLQDGYSYGFLTVYDADGSARTYGDDGCGRAPPQTTLPDGWVGAFPTEHSTSCPE